MQHFKFLYHSTSTTHRLRLAPVKFAVLSDRPKAHCLDLESIHYKSTSKIHSHYWHSSNIGWRRRNFPAKHFSANN